MIFIEVKALAGSNFIRAHDVIAVQQTSGDKCAIMMASGVTIPCSEPTKEVVRRLEEMLAPKENAHGDASR